MLRTLMPFLQTGFFTQIVITIPEGHRERVRSLLEEYLPSELQRYLDKIKLTEGGASRQESVKNGLLAFEQSPKFVLIHDGARPWIDSILIRRVLTQTEEHDACIPVIPSTDAMKQISPDRVITNHLERASTVSAQTPQGFRYDQIISAHQKAAEDDKEYIDDSEIYSHYVGPVYTVEGDLENRKITYLTDLGQYMEQKL